jgi:hypothetical protein
LLRLSRTSRGGTGGTRGGLERELRQAVQTDAGAEPVEIDPDLHRRAHTYLIRRDLLREVNSPSR